MPLGIGNCEVPTFVRSLFEEVPFVPFDLRVWISLTIGVSTIPRTGRSPARMISQTKGSRFPIASKQMEKQHPEKQSTPSGVRNGLESQQESVKSVAVTFHSSESDSRR